MQVVWAQEHGEELRQAEGDNSQEKASKGSSASDQAVALTPPCGGIQGSSNGWGGTPGQTEYLLLAGLHIRSADVSKLTCHATTFLTND